MKAADGDIIFGSHQSRQYDHAASSSGMAVRQNLKDYSTKTLTSSQSDMSAALGAVAGGGNKIRVNSRSHSNSQHHSVSQQQADVNSTFIAGSLASAFVSSRRKLSMSVDSFSNEIESSGQINKHSSKLLEATCTR